MSWSMVPVILFLVLTLRECAAQDDFSGKGEEQDKEMALIDQRVAGKERTAVGGFEGPIKCYTCQGTAENSSCSDPVDVNQKNIRVKVCDKGICLKWTKYRGGVLQMIRTCSADVDFHLTMIDGVCRTERNGNGWLCMCGKNLCNSVPRQRASSGHWPAFLALVFLLVYDVFSRRIWPT